MMLDWVNYFLWGWSIVFSISFHIYWIVLCKKREFSYTEKELLWVCLKKQETLLFVTNNDAKCCVSSTPHQAHITMDTWVFIDSIWYNKLQWAFIFHAVTIPYLANKSNFNLTSLSSTCTLLGLGDLVVFSHKSFQANFALSCPRISPSVSYFLCWKMVFRNNSLDSIASHCF